MPIHKSRCSSPGPGSRCSFAPLRSLRAALLVRKLTPVCASWDSYPKMSEIEVFLILLEFRFDVFAFVSAFEERPDAGVRHDLLKCGAIFGDKFNECVFPIVAQDIVEARNPGARPRSACRSESARQRRVQ